LTKGWGLNTGKQAARLTAILTGNLTDRAQHGKDKSEKKDPARQRNCSIAAAVRCTY
jgi:hypothetical protein